MLIHYACCTSVRVSSCGVCSDAGMQAEAAFVLHAICDLKQRSPQTPPTPLLYHTLALLHLVTGDNEPAVMYVQRALDLCPHGNDLHCTLQSLHDRLTGALLS